MDFFDICFWSALSITSLSVALNYRLSGSSASPFISSHVSLSKLDLARKKIQRNYLLVYAFMAAGDWLQGPYVYALYEIYGFQRETIAFLFVLGFGSSMVLGTIVGSLADRIGRKKSALLYSLLYSLSCFSKHYRNIYSLAFGRIFGGAATSLLMSVFESWLVCEYNELELKQSPGKQSNNGINLYSLTETFSHSTFLNFVIGIFAGIVSESLVGMFPFSQDPKLNSEQVWFLGGYTAPFDLAIVLLLLGALICYFFWTENFGTKTSPSSANQTFTLRDGVKTIIGSVLILSIGIAQSCFEASMYCFVFMWTPALSNYSETKLPFGKIFATFMLCSMLGSQMFSLLLKSWLKIYEILLISFLLSFFALGLGPVFQNLEYQYIGFLVFEICVGLFYPSMGSLKGQLIPEQNRATIYNLFRIPLNLLVLIVLLGKFSVNTTFVICTSLLAICALFQYFTNSILDKRKVVIS